MAKSDIRNPQKIDRPIFLARNFRYRDNAFHSPDVRQLRRSEYDIANGINSRLCGLHPLVGLDEAALGLNASFSKPMLSVFGLRPIAIRIFSASSFCCLPSAVNVTAIPDLVFSTLSTFAPP